MTKMEFANKVAELVNGEVNVVEKTNGVKFTGITLKEGRIRPTVYIENYYETDDVETAAEKIKGIFSENQNIPFNTDDISDYDKIKSKIVARLYNRKTKADVFRSAAPYGFEDLIIVPYIQLTDEASIKITRNLVDNVWKVTDENVLITAMENVDCEIVTMEEMLKDLNGMAFPGEIGMYVITNKSKSFGAVAALVADEKLREIFPEGYIILPSSVHEVIAISKNNSNNPLTQLICEVNQTEVVAETEVLSDHEYYF